MGQAIAVRTDYTAGEVRGFARRAKDAAQARRLVAIAAVLEGASRDDAAEIGGMDRQTLRDWVIRIQRAGAGRAHQHSFAGRAGQARCDAQGVSRPDRGGGANPAVHGVVRWRACDLIMRLHEEFDSRCRTTRSIAR